ncbi:nucleic acid-binding protein [Aspergillus ibericus CBS 121593]|uniref:Nucleic acid-binding protein n=1 Tax=Aspergillus ibericus CBS 121593 TaxID=1448316 RepID=A0A395H7B8_9EURO|nr:nucleic acid-binding protein [Aspergillus ibericus CBS 121593]RAL03812.1 nucleic acid-binding protein [Aspergillus ibericus CBS 121593]
MRPTNLLRALQPLRTSLIRSTPSTTTTPSLYHTVQRTLTTTTPRLNESQPQQPESTTTTPSPPTETPTDTPTAPTTVPPSLRSYPYKTKTGTVISVGRMDRTVRVSHRHTIWDKHIQKPYPKITTFLVSDPRNSLREGDVIEFSNGYPKTRNVHHVVERIIAPFGSAIEERPAVMSRAERDAERAVKRAAKWERREARRVEKGGLVGEGGREHVGRIRRLVGERMAATNGQVVV